MMVGLRNFHERREVIPNSNFGDYIQLYTTTKK